jgi:HEPN domain-containing protein
MLTKESHIKYWVESAQEDWDTAIVLKNNKRYGFCLFSLHLVLEKLLKALWIQKSLTNTPPYSHDLIRLSDECELQLTLEQLDFLATANSWNIRGRYPDYSRSLHQSATPAYLDMQFEKVKTLKKWLQNQL